MLSPDVTFMTSNVKISKHIYQTDRKVLLENFHEEEDCSCCIDKTGSQRGDRNQAML